MAPRFCLMVLLCGLSFGAGCATDVALVRNGTAAAAIVIAPGTMTADKGDAARLKASVSDLVLYVKKMSGAELAVVEGALPAGDARTPIYIGAAATEVFGTPGVTTDGAQGLRIVVSERGIGLIGESDLATSYAIYTVLDRFGCRWYMPSEIGEVIPDRPTLALPLGDESLAPHTIYRTIWFADEDYKRRNRLGGVLLNAGHALEGYVSKEDRAAHPEWQAMNQGKPSGRRLKWSAPGVPEAIAAGIERYLERYPETRSVSLSPDDGLGYDDTDDRKLDAGDFDPSINDVSLTDRQVWLCNRIVEIVNRTHPGILYGMLAYGASTRPPVREDVHPQIIPQIAPITYRRAHPMTWDEVPDNRDLREAIVGWAKKSPRISYYFYGWFLAEPSAPNPFITKWSEDIKFIYEQGNCRLWQPETLPNFETTMHALYLGIRLAWDPGEDPAAIVAELNRGFYGAAAAEMTAYWDYIDHVWLDVPEYSGCGFGHLRRWTPERLVKARALLDAGRAAAQTEVERQRIELAHQSLAAFELFMALRRDLAEGRWQGLDVRAQAYKDTMNGLANQYRAQYAFCSVPYLAKREDNNTSTGYFNAFYRATYNDAARLATETRLLGAPLRTWRYQADPESAGEAAGWQQPAFADDAWKTTDICVDTWSALGYHGYLGKMWYRATVDVPALRDGEKLYLWLGATDGSAKLFVNGQHVPWIDAKGEAQESFSGYCAPASFDITAAATPGQANRIAILCDRQFINELGTGGLLGAPVRLYAVPPKAE